MSTRLADSLWPACLSALHLDRFLAGELDELAARRVRQHVLACSRCAGAVEGMRAARDEPLPPLRVVPLAPRARRWPRAAAAGIALAAAASLLLVVRTPGERPKGSGIGLRMYVEHGGEVRPAVPGEVIAPGDAVRFAVTTPRKAFSHTTFAPGMALIEPSSTFTGTEPATAGRIMRPCTMPGTLMSTT